MILSMLVLGMCATVRAQVGMVYLLENVQKKHFSIAVAVFHMFEGAVMIIGALYFLYATKNWFWLILAGWIMAIIGTVGVFFFPESPVYLIKSGQLIRAQEVFEIIAKKNGTDLSVVTTEQI